MYKQQTLARCRQMGSGGFGWNTTILLVEDSKIQKIRNDSVLHKAGYKVLSAADGEEALRVARENSRIASCWTCCCRSWVARRY
jgi:PleD family two-component response regulator